MLPRRVGWAAPRATNKLYTKSPLVGRRAMMDWTTKITYGSVHGLRPARDDVRLLLVAMVRRPHDRTVNERTRRLSIV